jgi:hypothetical protein
MEFSHGIEADIEIDSVSYKGYVEMIDCTFDRDTADIKVLSEDWVQHVQGCRSMRVSLSGAFDPVIDGILYTAYNSDLQTNVVVTPQSGRTYTFNAWVTLYKPGPSGSNDKALWSAELISDSTVASNA